MKRGLNLLLIFSVLFMTVVFASTATHADDSSDAPMTQAHIARIRSDCTEAQTSLYQLHATDALLRVDRGELYETIATKLMTPFNSWIVNNNLDASSLQATANTYNQQLAAFRDAYQQYEASMTNTLSINCINEPVTFYDSVADTRDKRETVHEAVVALQSTIQTYDTEFEAFSSQFLKGVQ